VIVDETLGIIPVSLTKRSKYTISADWLARSRPCPLPVEEKISDHH